MGGCEGSVLLDGTPGAPGEQKAIPNQTLRPRAIQLIEGIRSLRGRTFMRSDRLML
ncbi:hypothetical protein QJS10_CPA08g00625 [Acorus calamus]|uniref:Uncharacterized protein n=1 Tax=Acorus calamus TaxID=4465 RepID=A0AAV9EAL2_ACOCL|nr:hypothetical protein QJS10_CPA08g00625 [Acorus calamus]